jgi:hypothetical protein
MFWIVSFLFERDVVGMERWSWALCGRGASKAWLERSTKPASNSANVTTTVAARTRRWCVTNPDPDPLKPEPSILKPSNPGPLEPEC